MDCRPLSPRPPIAPLHVQRCRTLDHLHIEHQWPGRAAHHVDPAVLELAGRHPALVLPNSVAQRRTDMERDSHLDLDYRYISDCSRTLSWHITVPARQGQEVVALSRPVLLASPDRAGVRNLRAHLRGERADFNEPLGLSREPEWWRRDGPARRLAS